MKDETKDEICSYLVIGLLAGFWILCSYIKGTIQEDEIKIINIENIKSFEQNDETYEIETFDGGHFVVNKTNVLLELPDQEIVEEKLKSR